MDWGEVELEPEIVAWRRTLGDEDRAALDFNIDRLAVAGPLLSEPYTRQLLGKLRELRFYVGGQQTRITYFIAPGRRIVLLTVFRKTRPREAAEIRRAYAAMERCRDCRSYTFNSARCCMPTQAALAPATVV